MLQLPSPVVGIRDEPLDEWGVRVLLKRDDLIHPEIPGNKWRKLKYNVEAARGVGTLLTCGGRVLEPHPRNRCRRLLQRVRHDRRDPR